MGDLALLSIPQLEESIKLSTEQLESLGTQHVDHAYLLSKLSDLWLHKSRKTMQESDLDQAIQVGRHAVDAMLPTEPNPANIFESLDTLLFRRFKIVGNRADLEEAEKLMRQALNASKIHSAQWVNRRDNLNLLLLERFRYLRDMRALDEVIETSQLLLDLRTEGKCNLPIIKTRQARSAALCARAKVKGSISELREGIAEGYRALDACSPSDPGYGSVASSLPAAVMHHYESTQLLDVLNEVMRLSQHALETVPEDDDYRPSIILNHGVFLFHYSERVRNSDPKLSLEYMEQAITMANEAIDITPSDWSKYNLVNMLDCLCAWLGLKVKLTGDVLSGQAGVQIAEEALQIMPVEYRERPTVLNNLVCTLDALFGAFQHTDRDKALEYLKRAVQVGTSAVSEGDEADPRYAERMLNLAAMHAKLSLLNDDDEDEFQKAKGLWLSAAGCSSALPVVRVSASLKAGQASFADDDFDTSYAVLSSAVHLLPRISPRWVSSADQQHLLSQGSGIAGLAAAAAVQLDKDPYEALKRLETGRCVVAGLTMNVKDDVSELKVAHPQLCERYDDLRQSFSRGPQAAYANFLSQENNFSQVNDDMNRVENEIRRQVGFENFQLPLSAGEMQSLAKSGPIIVFNVVHYRSDAFIVTSQDIVSIQLSDLKYEDLEKNIEAMKDLGFGTRRRDIVLVEPIQPQQNIKSILQWLWDVAVKPVLDKTTLTESKRIWWMTNGLMALAPLHAAGNHAKGSRDNTLSHVISSYISSFKALAYARKKPIPVSPPPAQRFLLLAMANTPGHLPLKVEAEEKILNHHFGAQLTAKPQPTTSEVLALLPHYPIIHLACHGHLFPRSPSSSGLIFMSPSLQSPSTTAILPISAIEKLSPPTTSLSTSSSSPSSSFELAFLSACSTAELSFGRHIDEAINLANCFQVLGFRHVIGTIWSASDASAGVIATKFYGRLSRQIEEGRGKGELDVAGALHEAVTEYKVDWKGEDWEGALHWGPWIHVGV
ncbi:uncharacterized protein KY384_000535 [Bacidia gigantensis]|uniref:uncharacterized protein n=1 Tax=Bacidia gigantensis TaxID=2732470 RepID=UPI001D0567AB|nr:uncharacterized protein KY384_000535 [Bacidia gigantensis]KAG8525775.1 hypothetical protein KY384_000535 [Bacidia gigantensis]